MIKNSIAELTFSQTALRRRIDNTPSKEVVANLEMLIENVIKPIREKFNIYVSSGYRSPELNKRIGGSKTSQHMTGQAADLIASDNNELFDYILNNIEFDQLIAEFGTNAPAWVHVSFSATGNRKQVLIAKRLSTKVVYVPYSPKTYAKHYPQSTIKPTAQRL